MKTHDILFAVTIVITLLVMVGMYYAEPTEQNEVKGSSSSLNSPAAHAVYHSIRHF